MKTTLNLIREHSPCSDGWNKLLRTLGKTKADDEPLSIIQILDSNGLDDALWCLRAVPNRDKEIRLYAVWCARQVEHLMTDDKSIEAVNVAEKFANGLATRGELDAAGSAARSAAKYTAWDAAGAAAEYAAWHAARSAAEYVAWNAAWHAARSAAEYVAGHAAGHAAGATASDSAGDAAGNAAWYAAGAACDATGATRYAQEAQLRLICTQIEQGGDPIVRARLGLPPLK